MPKYRSTKSYDLEYVLQQASSVIDSAGYVSGKKVYESDKKLGLVSTADRVRNVCEGNESISLCTEDVANAKAGVKYLEELNPKNDFEENMKRLVDGSNANPQGTKMNYTCADRDIAFAVCVHMGVNNQRKRVKQVAESAASDYIGEVGKRDEFFVKLVEHIYSAKADYNIYRLQDRVGNLGLFFSNLAPEELKVEVGECLLMKMTPKRQDVSTYHGGKETVFNRIKILKNAGAVNA